MYGGTDIIQQITRSKWRLTGHVAIVDSSNTDLLVLGWVGVMSINSDVLSSGVFGQLKTAASHWYDFMLSSGILLFYNN